jgi:hypothetical protein
VISLLSFEAIYSLRQCYDSVHRLLTLKTTAVRTFERSASSYSTTQRNSPKDLVPQYESGLATNNVFQFCAVFSP